MGRNQTPLTQSQLELGIERRREPDRNFEKGGRSFYFFDFDDNIAFLSTPSFIFHKETGKELTLTSGEFAKWSRSIGVRGPYAEYKIDLDPRHGTFRCFRDQDISVVEKTLSKRQMFVEDMAEALGYPDFQWKGPSWDCFYHAVFNQRPVSLITARGHHPSTLRDGIRLMVDLGHLPQEPNYLSIYPVSHPDVIAELGGEDGDIPSLKQLALRRSVEKAVEVYGENHHHRFGMSDDDPKNLEWIFKEMLLLKQKFPENSFFVIETAGGRFVKHEIHENCVVDQVLLWADQRRLDPKARLKPGSSSFQLSLFEE